MRFHGLLTALLAWQLCGVLPLSAADWLQWRGNSGNGVSSEKNLPREWAADRNIAWKVSLPGEGNSTPIIVGDQVFITCPTDGGKKRHLIAYDKKSGKENWRATVDFPDEEVTHATNPQCSGSPVSDGKVVVVWHGSAGLHCYKLTGEKLWSAELGKFEHIWGVGSSPVIFEDNVILSAGPGLTAFVASYKLLDGTETWRKEFEGAKSTKPDEFRGSWATPVVYSVQGKPTLFLGLPQKFYALDPKTGDEIWSATGLSDLVYTSALVNDQYAVAMCGYTGPALAIKHGGQGDVSESHKAWLTTKKNPQRVGSGVIVDGHIYIYNENGIVWCIELATGKTAWQERIGGESWSSAVYADEHFYVTDMSGVTHVLKVSPEGVETVAQNSIPEMTRASLAISDGKFYLRTYQHLYCIGQ